MKKKLLEALKTKFKGVSEAYLSRAASSLARTIKDESEIDAVVEDYTFDKLIQSYGDSRANEATVSSVSNYESKYGLKDGKPVDDENSGENPDDDKGGDSGTDDKMPKWAKVLIEQNKKLEQSFTNMQNNRTKEERMQKLTAVVSDLPETLQASYLRTPVEGISDEAFTELMNTIGNEVEKIKSESDVRGAAFSSPKGGTGGQDGKELTKAQIESISKREGFVAGGEAQPF